MIFGRGLEQENSKLWGMDVLSSRLFLEQSIASNVSCSGERMHAFGGYCDRSILWRVVDRRYSARKW